MTPRVSKPELLAPAGDWEAMRAAVANGADAVYFGVNAFNARHRAANFGVDEIPEVFAYLHGHNVRGYVTLNTLIFSDELPQVLEIVRRLADAGADAVIVQDLGLAKLIHRFAAGLPVHGSTQMTLTEPRGIDFVKSLGVERVILARELSIPEVSRIAGESKLPVEVFVHGALCISYSGQCLTSESIGGRSANRGQCAQACRLPYELIVDDRPRDLGDKAYLLSPQDLAGHDVVNELADAGVVSLKIEGRLKSPHYVAATTQTYRAAIDAHADGRSFAASRQQITDLQQSFSRGFTRGFLSGLNHQTLVPARFPKSRGVRAGVVTEVTRRGVVVELADPRQPTLKPGDGVVFDEGHPEQDEQGGRVFEVIPRQGGRGAEIVLGDGDVNLGAIAEGATVWKTDDPAMRRRLERSFSRDVVVNREPLRFRIDGAFGGGLTLTATDTRGRRASATWEGPLQKANKHPLDPDAARSQLDRLGDTPYTLGDVELAIHGAMAPRSVLNELRRRVVEDLLAQRATGARRGVTDSAALDALRVEARAARPPRGTPDAPTLHVLVRSDEQLDAVIAWQPPPGLPRPAGVYCDYEDIRLYRDAVRRSRGAGLRVFLATTRIIKPGEEGLLRQVAASEPDGVLVRNLAGLAFFRQEHAVLPLVADYSMNVANELTARLLADHGVERMTPSYDLNWSQLSAMFHRFDPGYFEAVVHQHMPMFHMEHCVFAATLSNGKDHRDCGRPCDRHRVELRDRVGHAHPLLADVGCRNTLFNAQAQSAAEFVPRMVAAGLRHFRVEFLREDAALTRETLTRYANILAGREEPRAARRSLNVLGQLGVTAGTLDFE